MNESEKEYSSHKEQIAECQPPQERIQKLEESLIEAYEKVITYKEVPGCISILNKSKKLSLLGKRQEARGKSWRK